MKSGKDCRIVFVCSEAHQKAKFDVVLAEQGKSTPYDATSIYNNTKLFQVGTVLIYSRLRIVAYNTTY